MAISFRKAIEILRAEMVLDGLNPETGDLHKGASFSQDSLEAHKMAIEALEKADKYRWHDLRKDPADLPKENGDYLVMHDYMHAQVVNFIRGHWNVATERDGSLYLDAEINNVIAWKEIEPLEVTK